MRQLDVPARGQVGDETPLTAIDDAVRDFHPNHLLIALRSSDEAGWQERGLLEQLRGRYRVPITIFEIRSAD
jgi:GABA permease